MRFPKISSSEFIGQKISKKINLIAYPTKKEREIYAYRSQGRIREIFRSFFEDKRASLFCFDL